MIALRPYQSAQLAQLDALAGAGHRAVLLQAPTGSGKGACIVHLNERCVAKQNRALVIVPRIVLGEDLVERHVRAGVRAGLIQADSVTDDDAPVQIATHQTLAKRGVRPEANLVIVDEARHVLSESMRETLTAYPRAFIVAFDATPQRSDGQHLGDIFTAIIQGPSIAELTRAQWLVPADVFAPAQSLEAGHVAQHPVDAYLAHAPGQRALVFASSIAHAREIASEAKLRGIAVELLLGETSRAQRFGIVDRVTSGAVRMIVNVAVATEGFDLPAIECVILACGSDHVSMFLQRIGRALRPSPETGKTRCTVLDLRGSVHLHGLPDSDRVWSLNGTNGGRTRAQPVFRCLECGSVHEEPGPCPRCSAVATRTRKLPVVLTAAEKLARIEAIEDPAARARAKWSALCRQARAWNRHDPVKALRIAAAQWRKRENCEPPR